jgi:phenylacetate-CoA ligase
MLATPEIIREGAQLSRLSELVPRWQQVPMYRDYPFRRGASSSARQETRLGDLPFISKREIIRDFPTNFLPPGQSLEKLQERNLVELEHTSGTTEEQMQVMFRQGWWDLQERRALDLNTLAGSLLDQQPDARRATLTTPACSGRVCFSAWRSRAHRTIGNTLFVNQSRIPFVMTDAELARMAEEIIQWEPRFLDTDPVHGAWFALYCERNRIRFPSLKFILASYEFVSLVPRRILERAFQVPVYDLYGSTETGHLLMEDTRGQMKPCLENAFLELIGSDARNVAELVVTTLTNDFMPLLRYRIGDLVERCEHPYGSTYVVHGRLRDTLRDRRGERVTTWQVDECFNDITGLAAYQLQQAQNGECRLRYVAETDGMSARNITRLVSRLEDLLEPPVGIIVEPVKKLPPTPSGKFRLTARVDAIE